MIQDYLERLARELSFDRSLSRCVRQEVEDHLWEAVAADSTGDALAAQQRAIANFGDVRAIAAQFAVISLARHSRRAGVAAVLVIAGVFIAMKARIAWYAAAQWAISDDMRAVSGLVVQIDRYAFWLSLIVGLGGCVYIVSRRSPQRSIRPIAGNFAASSCCALPRPQHLSFRLSAMECSPHSCYVERIYRRDFWSRSSRWRLKSRASGFWSFTFAASRCGRRPRRPC
jgi:hypothetical protein